MLVGQKKEVMKKKKLTGISNLSSIDRSEGMVAVKGNMVGKIQMNDYLNTVTSIGFNLLINSGVISMKNPGDGRTSIVTRTSFYPLIKDVFYTTVFN